ncbi:signal peptidase II [soil metagenome]
MPAAVAVKYFLRLSLPLYVIDQITKEIVVRNFAAPETGMMQPHPVIPGFFELVRVHNTGIAFGRFNGGEYSNLIFGIIAAAALIGIAFFARKGAFPTMLAKTSAALLVSGILGNLTDRLARGYVVDFLHFDLGFMIWPSFNVADACICIAAVLLFISGFQKVEDPTPAPADAGEKKPG